MSNTKRTRDRMSKRMKITGKLSLESPNKAMSGFDLYMVDGDYRYIQDALTKETWKMSRETDPDVLNMISGSNEPERV